MHNTYPVRQSLVAAMACLLIARGAPADAPLVSNVRAAQRAGTHLVDVNYDLYDADGGAITVSMAVSTNAGLTYDFTPATMSGDIGAGVYTGLNKTIIWNAGADWGAGRTSAAMRVRVTADDGAPPVIPPNPEDVASTPEPGETTLIGDSTAFLYTGTNPVQTGVASGTINAVRVAVLRGRVTDRTGLALSGVVVRVEGHVEYGQTLTRADGRYDLAVNGASVVNLNFTRNDYLTIQRSVTVPWQEYVNLDTVAMPTADTNVTVVTLAGGGAPTNGMLTAAGGAVSDAAGTRRARVLLPADVAAQIITYGGRTQAVDTLTTRLTEYTVGTNGPNAMPGNLPDTVAYTYCVELGAAEAEAKVDGRDVLLSTTAYFYVDNFLGMPPGIGVPMAYYDRTAGAWIPSTDGRVIDLKGATDAGLAEIDADGDGLADDDAALAALGFTASERRQLAADYQPATNSLWRVPITHFSTYDCNYGVQPADGAVAPDVLDENALQGNPQVQEPHVHNDQGTVELENQVLREYCGLPGTPFSLHYSSRRAPGNLEQARLDIPLSTNTIPGIVQRIDLEVSIAGRTYHESFAPASNLTYTFEWDGYDAYGRVLHGVQPLKIRIGYVYDGYYTLPAYLNESFGFPSGVRAPGNVRAREMVTLWSEAYGSICFDPAYASALGAWSLNVHHAYDPFTRQLFQGDGGLRIVQPNNLCYVIYTAAGGGDSSTENIAATNAVMNFPSAVAAAPDGSYYVAEWHGHKIRKVTTNGIIATVAGTGGAGFSGDGGPATAAAIDTPSGLALGRDGSLYFTDTGNHRVRRISPAGIITTVAGSGVQGGSGDDGPARNAQLNQPWGLAVAADGTLFISELGNHCIRRVSPSGRITTIAGRMGVSGYAGDGGPATNALFSEPRGLALGPDGSLYIAADSNARVRRMAPDGTISCFAGNGSFVWDGFYGDGGPATNAAVCPWGLAVRDDGVVFIADHWSTHIRRVEQNGIISTVAGSGAILADGRPARNAMLQYPTDLDVMPNGDVLIAGYTQARVLRLTPAVPGTEGTDMLIASEDGREVFLFNRGGRHLATYNALTGSNLLTFAYDTNGLLTSVTDGDGNRTAIQRAANGLPLAIVGADGVSNRLTVDAQGCLTAVIDPAGNTNHYTYTTNGLLTAAIGPRGPAFTYGAEYGARARLARVTDPGGGFKHLARAVFTNGWRVASTTAMGRVNTAEVRNYPTGNRLRMSVEPDGGCYRRYENIDSTITQVMADASTVQLRMTQDDRFGMQAPVKERMILRLPSGLAYTAQVARAAALASASPLSLTVLTNTVNVNGRIHKSVYVNATRTITDTTPAGRQYQTVIDDMGRALSQTAAGLAVRCHQYDARGRLTNISDNGIFDTRVVLGMRYDANGYCTGLRDGLDRWTELRNNAVGWPTQVVYPNGAVMNFDHDAHGNVAAVTPPGRLAHVFAYNDLDLPQSYTPPSTGGDADAITFYYNTDRQLTQVNRADGRTNLFEYYANGRLQRLRTAAGDYVYAWHSNGHPATISSPCAITVSNVYDGALPCGIAWSGAITGCVDYVYNTDLRASAFAVNGGGAISMRYDADGLLTNAGANFLMRNADSGRIAGTQQGDFSDTWTYNDAARLIGYEASHDASNLLTQACWYDAAGRLTNLYEIRREDVLDIAYYYDDADRLSEVRTNGVTAEFYQYDPNGNRTNWVVDGVSGDAQYDARDRMTAGAGFTNYFDPDGALTGRVVAGAVWAYEHEGASLTGVTLPGGARIEYLCDGMGRRMGRTVDGVLDRGFLYGAYVGPIAELDATTNLLSVFVYGTRANVPDYMVRAGNVYRIVSDRLGSPRLVVDLANGDVVQELDYDAFGRVTRNTNPDFQPFGFAGGLYDHDTGLVKFGVRDYDAASGRWLVRDPLLFFGYAPNLYAYVGNQPVNFTDPLGLGIDKGDLFNPMDLLGLVGATIGLSPKLGAVSGTMTVLGWMNYGAGPAPGGGDVSLADGIHDFVTVGVAGVAGFCGPKGAVLAFGIAAVDVTSKAGFTAWCNAAAMRDTAIQDALGPRGRQLAPDFGIKYHHQPYVPPSSAPVMFMPAGPSAGYDVAPRVY